MLTHSPLVIFQQSIALNVHLAVTLGAHVLLHVLGGAECLVTPETHVTLTNLRECCDSQCGMRKKQEGNVMFDRDMT